MAIIKKKVFISSFGDAECTFDNEKIVLQAKNQRDCDSIPVAFWVLVLVGSGKVCIGLSISFFSILELFELEFAVFFGPE